MKEFGADMAQILLSTVKSLESEFYASTAAHTAPDLITMKREASDRFRELHPEISDAAVDALGWSYIYEWK